MLKFVSSPPLEADERGFIAGLAKSGFHEGANLQFIRRNCQGVMSETETLANEILHEQPSLIHAGGTPVAQGVQRARRHHLHIPFVFSSVTDPLGAGIVPAGSAPGQPMGLNTTGVSTPWPVELQLKLYASIVPQAKRWGTIFNPTESNSLSHLTRLRQATQGMGLTLVESTVTRSEDVAVAAATLVEQVQAVIISADNTSITKMEAIAQACDQRKVPLFAGTLDSVTRGAAVVFGLDFYLAGYAAGRKAALVLKGMDAGEIPWGPMQKFSLYVNLRAAKAQGIILTPDLLARADMIQQ